MNVMPSFWELKPLKDLSHDQWEKLCDRCGQCCVHKLLDEDGSLYLTDLACKNLDITNIWCTCYDRRNNNQSLCKVLTSNNLSKNMDWLPETCAYRRLYEKKSLPKWHPLISKDPESVIKSGNSILGKVVSESLFPVAFWKDRIVPDNYFKTKE